MFSSIKELTVISKDVLDVFCSPYHQRFYSFWSLFSKFPFDWLYIIFDVLSVGFFCEAGFLQVMVQTISTPVITVLSAPLPLGTSAEAQPPTSQSPMLPSVLLTIFPSTSRHSRSTASQVLWIWETMSSSALQKEPFQSRQGFFPIPGTRAASYMGSARARSNSLNLSLETLLHWLQANISQRWCLSVRNLLCKNSNTGSLRGARDMNKIS